MAARPHRELGAFLRAKRESLRPADVGIVTGGRRRTPGLRREELASLADVSTSWYTWLEQGRDIHVSIRLVDRIADALRMSAIERRHLHSLTERDHARITSAPETSPSLQRMLDTFEHIPAFVFDRRWDVIAANDMARRFSRYFPHAHSTGGNILRALFLDPQRRIQYLDWTTSARRCLMQFRTDFASNANDARYQELVTELCSRSLDFRTLWVGKHQVAYRDFAENFIAERRHPTIGLYTIEQITLEVGGTDLRVSISSPLPHHDSIRHFKAFFQRFSMQSEAETERGSFTT